MSEKMIGFIGAGKMGGAIIKGLLSSGFAKKEDIIASEATEQLAEKTSKSLGISVITDNKELVQKSDVIIFATKPFVIKEVLKNASSEITTQKLVLSIAAGVSVDSIESIIGQDIPIIRVMPNTPALVNEGMTAISRNSSVSEDQIQYAKKLFSNVGRCIEVPEKHLDSVTGISGSGPAFFYLIIEALADGGVKMGIPKQEALELAAQTALGAAKMVLESGKHPSILKDEVTTPGGCTAVGLSVLENEGVRAALIETVEKTTNAAKGLG